MGRNDTTSAIIDTVLKTLAVSTAITATLVAPNVIQILDKPLARYFTKLDNRSRQREARRILSYMKSQGLVRITSDNYEHGITITKAGIKRAKNADFERLSIKHPEKWDKQWRIVMFDVPERLRNERIDLTIKLRLLGFQLLQQSVWIHPFPCRKEVEIVLQKFDLSRYVSYIETKHIDNDKALTKRFSNLLTQK